MAKHVSKKKKGEKVKVARKPKPAPVYVPPPGKFTDKYAPGGVAGYIPASLDATGRLPAGA